MFWFDVQRYHLAFFCLYYTISIKKSCTCLDCIELLLLHLFWDFWPYLSFETNTAFKNSWLSLGALVQTAQEQKHLVILRMSKVSVRCKEVFFWNGKFYVSGRYTNTSSWCRFDCGVPCGALGVNLDSPPDRDFCETSCMTFSIVWRKRIPKIAR